MTVTRCVSAGSGTRRRWIAAWLLGAAVGVGNGILREATYGKRVSETRAHQLSGLTAVAAFAALFNGLERRWPIATSAEARQIGIAWLVMTVAFEFGFGRLVAKKTWRELTADYNLVRGRTWPFVLAYIAVGPSVARRLDSSARTP